MQQPGQRPEGRPVEAGSDGRGRGPAAPSGGERGLTGRVFDGVIFDMDGTLIDSTPAVVRAWATWAGEHGVTAERLANQHGMPAASIVARLLPAGDHARALARITELETADLDGVVPLPGTVHSLDLLPADRVAIATSCTRPLADARLTASEIGRPAVVITVDDVERGKPAPDPFLAAAAALGLAPGRCLVVEDAPAGLTAARAAGCATLAVVTTTPREELSADLVVPTLAEVEWTVDETGISVRPRVGGRGRASTEPVAGAGHRGRRR